MQLISNDKYSTVIDLLDEGIKYPEVISVLVGNNPGDVFIDDIDSPRAGLVCNQGMKGFYSRDADFIVEQARPSYAKYGADNKLCHKRYNGGHGLTKERFDYIIGWLCMSAEYTSL